MTDDLELFSAKESVFAPTAADFALAKQASEVLDQHYPGHIWACSADHRNGILTVQNFRLSGRWGVIIKIDTLKTDPGLKTVVRHGGELLERYRVARGRFNVADLSHLQPWARPKLDLGL